MKDQNINEESVEPEVSQVEPKKKKKGKLKKSIGRNKKFLLLFSLLFLMAIRLNVIASNVESEDQWDYKVVEYYSDASDRSGDGAVDPATVSIPEGELNTLGKQGWELVSSHIENETAYPNFGDKEYVTGLQPNVRPQKVVLIFKKPM